jgi:hypothetical protein
LIKPKSLHVTKVFPLTYEPPKERKFVECFKSNRDGNCRWCKRTWKTGNKIYAMKNTDNKWIACSDRHCYLDQGGNITEFNSKEPIMPDFPNSNPTLNIKSDRELIMLLMAKVSIIEHLIEGLVKK